MSLLQEALSKIQPIDSSLSKRVQARLDNLTKPQGSLGRLEEFALRYCLIRNTLEPKIKRRPYSPLQVTMVLQTRVFLHFQKRLHPRWSLILFTAALG